MPSMLKGVENSKVPFVYVQGSIKFSVNSLLTNLERASPL